MCCLLTVLADDDDAVQEQAVPKSAVVTAQLPANQVETTSSSVLCQEQASTIETMTAVEMESDAAMSQDEVVAHVAECSTPLVHEACMEAAVGSTEAQGNNSGGFYRVVISRYGLQYCYW
jgi:hypothetical protein